MSESNGLMETKAGWMASLEALLFVASEPVSPTRLATILEISTQEVEEILADIQQKYMDRGLRLQWYRGRVQLTTAPEKAELIERFLGLETSSRLTRPALETLAIIAYRQPVTRPNLDSVRGVNSDGVLKSLLIKGLIREEGRSEGPGRPILYGTTPEFLQYFGLNSMNDLPELSIVNNMRSSNPGEG